MKLSGLSTINIELTNRCNKQCWICGRRRVEKKYPELMLQYKDMDFELAKSLSEQLTPDIVVQLHNNGEPLLYPQFGRAAALFSRQITNIVTNGKLLVEKADEVIGCLDTLAVSVFEKDPEADEQYEIIEKFLQMKGDQKPYTLLRINGEVDETRYQKFGLRLVRRILHSPMGSFNYRRNEPTIPEIGICWDFLNHPAVNVDGKVSICVRFDPKGLGVIGDLRKESFEEIWNGPLRRQYLESHKKGLRDSVPLCAFCHFWGVPTSPARLVEHSTDADVEKKIYGK